ncbi:hypothetical protein B0O99DRAFT_640455 [Bisporella sp. PMI_857]|nr:hypothetical protein B0O99DRAFT_640455 [Bisporella sp. PMI_857]
MSNLDAFTLFPALSQELRLLIWSFAFIPRVIPLAAEAYRAGEDPTAIRFHLIQGIPLPPVERAGSRLRWTGRFVHPQIPSQAVFHVSREARNHALFLGYRTWKLQKKGGLVRRFLWHPAKDIVLFPRRNADDSSISETPYVHHYGWLRMFRVQYPTEIQLVQNVALWTSLWFRLKLERPWVVDQLFKFQNMQRLTIVIDEPHERAVVARLQERDIEHETWGSWKLPHYIVETLERTKDQNNLRFTIPEVRVIKDTNDIIAAPSLVVTLRCNPCEYLDHRPDPQRQ